MKTFKESIQDLLANDETVKAMQQLLDLDYIDDEWRQDIVQLRGRYQALEKDILNGVVSHAEITLERNKIRDSVLTLLNKLPSDINKIIRKNDFHLFKNKFIDYYSNNESFTHIHISGNAGSSFFGEFSFEDYYVDLSYIEFKELEQRDSLFDLEKNNKKHYKEGQRFYQSITHKTISKQILENNKRIIISGNPGVGKSTFSKFLCYEWIKTAKDHDRLLIHIVLRDIEFNNSGNAILNYLTNTYLEANDVSIPKLKTFLKIFEGQVIYILDGFDELNDDAKNKFYKQFNSLTYSPNFILLSRPYGLIDNQLKAPFSIQIDGFNESSQERYVRNILSNQNAANHIQEFFYVLYRSEILSNYANNPLMLSYMLLVSASHKEGIEVGLKELRDITSAYDLQTKVLHWFTDYYKGKGQITTKEVIQNLNKSIKFAAQLELNQQLVYISSLTNNKYIDSALFFSELGIGTLNKKERWSFSFNTITFQEFLTARYLSQLEDHKLFFSIFENKYFWNVGKMLINALCDNQEHDRVNDLLEYLEKVNRPNLENINTFIYFYFLSDCDRKTVNSRIEKFGTNILIKAFQKAVFIEEWRDITLDANVYIFKKLNLSLKKAYINNILDRFNSIDLESIEEVDSIYYLLSLVSNIDGLNTEVAAICFRKIKMFKEEIRRISRQLHELENHKDQGDTTKSSILYTKIDNYLNTHFYLIDIIKSLPFEQLVIFKDFFNEQVSIDYEDNLIDYAVVKAKIADSIDSLITVFRNSFYKAESMFEVCYSNLNVDKYVFGNEEIINAMLQLTCDIYSLGYANKKKYKTAIDYLTADIKKAICLLDKYLIRYTELGKSGFPIEDGFIYNLTEIFAHGINLISIEATYDDFFLFFQKWEKRENTREHFLTENDSFDRYITQKIKDCLNGSDSEEESLRKLYILITAFKLTENGKYLYTEYREELHNILCVFTEQYHEKLESFDDDDFFDSKERQIIEIFHELPFFLFDKYFSIDKVFATKALCELTYIQSYVLPGIFCERFAFYQEEYWNYLQNLLEDGQYTQQFCAILGNEDMYSFSSNFRYLAKLCPSLLEQLTTMDNAVVEIYANDLLAFSSNTLSWFIKNDKTYSENSSDKILSVLSSTTDYLLNHPSVVQYLDYKEYSELVSVDEILAYLYYYYLTNKQIPKLTLPLNLIVSNSIHFQDFTDKYMFTFDDALKDKSNHWNKMNNIINMYELRERINMEHNAKSRFSSPPKKELIKALLS